MESMGITNDQLEDLARQLRDLSGLDAATADQIARALGLDPPPAGDTPSDAEDETERPADDLSQWPPSLPPLGEEEADDPDDERTAAPGA